MKISKVTDYAALSYLNKVIHIIKFPTFYHRHSELIAKYNTGLKTLLRAGHISIYIYDNLVYKEFLAIKRAISLNETFVLFC